jgi:hypothetical protein
VLAARSYSSMRMVRAECASTGGDMQLILPEHPPRDFARIEDCFHQAEAFAHGDDAHRWKVGVCNEAGALAAVGELACFECVQAFLRGMEGLGYQPLILGTAEEMHGCDFLFNCLVPVH